MSQTGTPTEFLKLGITEPDDTLNVLVDLNGQWQKIDTGVKNVDTKANTNASGISALNTAVQDNTENITNILETNVNQQTSIDTLQSKVATLEQDDTSYGTRITAVEAGVQENSELINDLEVDLSGVKTSVGTVPSGSTLQGQVDGLDTRVTTLETEVGTVPAGKTVQGQITTLNGQVNSGNIPFRFSVDGGGNYGYLKADDSFVPFRSGSPTSLDGHEIVEIPGYSGEPYSVTNSSYVFYNTNDQSSPYYKKAFYIPTKEMFDVSQFTNVSSGRNTGHCFMADSYYYYYDRNNHSLVQLASTNDNYVCSGIDSITYYTYVSNNLYTLHYIDLIDSTNNFTLDINFPSDKHASTTTGRKDKVFVPYGLNNAYSSGIASDTLIIYFTDTKRIHAIYKNGSLSFVEYDYNSSIDLKGTLTLHTRQLGNMCIEMSNNKALYLESDFPWGVIISPYTMFGKYAVSTY